MEKWEDIKGYETWYQISNMGKVRSLPREESINNRWGDTTVRKIKGKILIQSKKDGKYKVVNLSKEGKTKSHYVHRLVASHFISLIQKGLAVNHIDSNIDNNDLSNLEIITRRDNTYHGLVNKKYSSKFIGVHWNVARKKWIATIKIKGNKSYLGGFEKEIDAYNTVLMKLKESNIESIYV